MGEPNTKGDVERVARRICEAAGIDPDVPMGGFKAPSWTQFEQEAEAAIHEVFAIVGEQYETLADAAMGRRKPA